jgi:hypothetical protein
VRSLVRERAKAVGLATKALAVATILMLWLSANKPELSLTVALVDISVPISYVNFAMALALFAGLLQVVTYFVLNDFIRIASNKLLRFDAPWALTVPEDGASAWSVASIPQFRFLASKRPHRLVGYALISFVCLPFLMVFGAIYWTAGRVGLSVLAASGYSSMEAFLTLIAWLIAALPVACVVLMLIPFSFTKNIEFIRWLFLTRIYRRMGRFPPRVDSWLAESHNSRARQIRKDLRVKST